MRILFLTFYFEPDLCAGSFRSSALIQELTKYKDIKIDVVTTKPNRYVHYEQHADAFEILSENVHVYRIKTSSHKSGLLDQIISFTHYFLGTRKLVKGREYDFIFASSSRLFTAYLGALIARKMGKPLYLDIRDLFSKSTTQILHQKKLAFLKFPILFIEKFTFSTASKINLVSEGFKPYIDKKFPNKALSFYTNGIDDLFLKYDYTKNMKNYKKIELLYAGNIGEGQGLHKILPKLAKSLDDKVEIIVIGDGGKRLELLEEIERQGCINIKIKAPVGRNELLEYYKRCDVLFLHLNNFEAFEEVIPSKIFEYAATGKPILAGVGGFSREFIEKNVKNCEVFKPCDLSACLNAYQNLSFQMIDRNSFKTEFSRSSIMNRMSEDIYRCCTDLA